MEILSCDTSAHRRLHLSVAGYTVYCWLWRIKWWQMKINRVCKQILTHLHYNSQNYLVGQNKSGIYLCSKHSMKKKNSLHQNV